MVKNYRVPGLGRGVPGLEGLHGCYANYLCISL